MTTTLSSGYVSFGSSTYLSATDASVVYAAPASTPTLTNAGTLVESGGAYYAISFAGSGTVTNSGSIAGSSPLFFGAAGASLDNSGTIAAAGGRANIELAAGGVVTNASDGVINADINAPFRGGAVTLNNAGLISYGGRLVGFYDGGTVTNSGTITGLAQYGVRIANGDASIANSGLLSGGDVGVRITGGYGIINNTAGSITGSYRAVYIQVGAVTNSALIAGGTTDTRPADLGGGSAANVGVELVEGGVVTNNSGGTITGFYGVASYSGNTRVYNYGSIVGSNQGIVFGGDGTITNGSIVTGELLAHGNFVLDNLQGGTIQSTGGNGMYLFGLSSTITNAGSIGAANGNGVRIVNSSVVSNASTGTITGSGGGVVTSSYGDLTNAGAIAGTSQYAVFFLSGGTVDNQGTAASLVGGIDGIDIQGGAGTITNEGAIRGSASSGIYLHDGGTVTNSGAASDIFGLAYGVKGASGAAFTVVNSGTILGNGTAGISGTAVVTNNYGAQIVGFINGVDLAAGSTLVNAGFIRGVYGEFAVSFSGAGLVVIDPGASFDGFVSGGGNSTLELANTGTAGVLIGGYYSGFSQLTVDRGATWSMGSITTPITVTAGDGALTVNGSIISGTTFDLDSTGAGETLTLTGATGGEFTEAIDNVTTNDKIVLPGETFAAGDFPVFDSALGKLAILDSGGDPVFVFEQFTAPAGVTSASFVVGTDFVQEVPCFCAGTCIATRSGPVAVEHLAAGDLVATRDRLRPVRWVGQRRIDCRRHPKPEDVWPVRIRADAFGPGAPYADLLLSPDHAVFVEGVLIPVRYLVNGRTIAQEPRDEVTYFHVELDRHAVILAEGLACESYLDTGNRGAFANGGAALHMHPDFALNIWHAEACARLVLAGPELVAARRRLLDRAGDLGHAITGDPDLRLIAGGRELRPVLRGRRHRFHLPAGAGGLRLISRSAIPAEVRADDTDHRRLGVAVSRIACDGSAIPLDDPRVGGGWHDLEAEGWRWTDGDARLALAGGRRLDIEVALTVCYWADEPPVAHGVEEASLNVARRYNHP